MKIDEDIMGSCSVGERNERGERSVGFATANSRNVINTFFNEKAWEMELHSLIFFIKKATWICLN